jgi:putative transposase
MRFHEQTLPQGSIKMGRIVKRASGWYLCLFIDTTQAIPPTGEAVIGIDPGLHHLLTLSSGEKMPQPHELRHTAQRLAQAQRGHCTLLAARLCAQTER